MLVPSTDPKPARPVPAFGASIQNRSSKRKHAEPVQARRGEFAARRGFPQSPSHRRSCRCKPRIEEGWDSDACCLGQPFCFEGGPVA